MQKYEKVLKILKKNSTTIVEFNIKKWLKSYLIRRRLLVSEPYFVVSE
jgi:hypothetical protein